MRLPPTPLRTSAADPRISQSWLPAVNIDNLRRSQIRHAVDAFYNRLKNLRVACLERAHCVEVGRCSHRETRTQAQLTFHACSILAICQVPQGVLNMSASIIAHLGRSGAPTRIGLANPIVA
jgi:hypothetical protein